MSHPTPCLKAPATGAFLIALALLGGALVRQRRAARDLARLNRQTQEALGPLAATLFLALPQNTRAVQANTAAVRETQFQQTTVITFGGT